MKIFLPPDTMKFDKETWYIAGLKFFLDLVKTMLQRTINAKEEYITGKESRLYGSLFFSKSDISLDVVPTRDFNTLSVDPLCIIAAKEGYHTAYIVW
jgi:hypothetical protein